MTAEKTTKKAGLQAVKRIHFESFGQDFTHIDINDDGMVVDCPEFHRPVWIGVFVHLETLKPGKLLNYVHPRSGQDTFKYRVSQVEDLRKEDEE